MFDSVPWVESPLFPFPSRGMGIDSFSQALQYNQQGYLIVDLPDIDIEGIKRDIQATIDRGEATTQAGGYHYSNSPRIFEAWRNSRAVLNLARHPKVLSTLEFLYRRKPIPFQTINFVKGSNQPLHSDVIHFHTIPHRWVVGVWAALENMDGNNGTLQYVPGSHKLPIVEFQDIGLPKAKPNEQFESYAKYEDFIKNVVRIKELPVRELHIKKGQALLWAANLIHGGIPIKDPSRTRWSQATHYYFEGCRHYYAPMFSDPYAGEYAEKDLSKKDILGHVISG